MSNIHFIGGEKGGVGKSLTARILAQYYVDHNLSFIGFDSDASHQTFTRFYGEFTAPVTVSDFESLDTIIASLEEDPDRDIILDLAAQTRTPLLEWMSDSDALDMFEELGCQVYLWHVMDDGADSMSLLANLLDNFANKNVRIIAVQNYGRGEDFEHVYTSDIWQTASAQGVEVIKLKKLQPALMRKIDFNNFSFWAAANNARAMTLAERKRVKVWLENAYEQMDSLITFDLIPSEMA